MFELKCRYCGSDDLGMGEDGVGTFIFCYKCKKEQR